MRTACQVFERMHTHLSGWRRHTVLAVAVCALQCSPAQVDVSFIGMQTILLLASCFVSEAALLFLIILSGHQRSQEAVRAITILHVIVLSLCSVFGFIWHRAVAKVRQH